MNGLVKVLVRSLRSKLMFPVPAALWLCVRRPACACGAWWSCHDWCEMITVVATKVSFGAVGLGGLPSVFQSTRRPSPHRLVRYRLELASTLDAPTRWETGTIARLDTVSRAVGRRLWSTTMLRTMTATGQSKTSPCTGAAAQYITTERWQRLCTAAAWTRVVEPHSVDRLSQAQKDTLAGTEVEVQVMLGDDEEEEVIEVDEDQSLRPHA